VADLLVADGVRKEFGGLVATNDVDFTIPTGSIVSLIGPNGAGKTTFLKMIMGREKPDTGKVVVGPTVSLCYVDQLRDDLDPEATVFQQITGNQEQLKFGSRWVNGRAYVSKFAFRGTDQQTKVGELSGGQRNRVQLASLLRRGGNLYLLDEPTNDLDLETLRVLEEALQNFVGSLIIVTHDRYFLNRIATHVLAFDGEGGARFFEGDFSTFEERLANEREAEGKGPAGGAEKYRKFTR
jgi:energy-dependent translational throttle protein EttA